MRCSYDANGPTLSMNNWHHLVGVREGDYIRFYVNGTLANSTFVGSASINNVANQHMLLGRTGAGNYTNAGFDELSIYNRALSASEVGELFGLGCGDYDVAGEELVEGYRYGFNGMEKDDEVKGFGNHVDFGARGYDPRLGRWFAVDPLASKYPFSSSYSFALNTPLQAVDPNGKEVIPAGKEEIKHLNSFISSLFGSNSGFKASRKGIRVNEKKLAKSNFKGDLLDLADRLKEISTNKSYTVVFKLGTAGTVRAQVGTEMQEIPNYITRINAEGTQSVILDPVRPTRLTEVPIIERIDISDVKNGVTVFPNYDGNILPKGIVLINPNSQGNENPKEDMEGQPYKLDNNATTAHELLGHVHDIFTGSKSDSSVSTENKARSFLGLKKRSGSDHGHPKVTKVERQ